MPNFLTFRDLDERISPADTDIMAYQKDIGGIWYWGRLTFLNIATWFASSYHIVGADGVTNFMNSWVNMGSPYLEAAYKKNKAGRVSLRGCVKNGTVGTYIFTLPVGYRPSGTVRFPALATGAFGWLSVDANGNVLMGAGSNSSCFLDCVSFDV